MKKKLLHMAALSGALIAISAAPAYADTGWVTTNGNNYYYDSNGNMCKGWTQINGAWYYFGANYGAMQTGLLTLGNQLYYLDSNGAMQTGQVRLPDGKTYTFSAGGALTASPGWNLINGSYYYFDTANTVVTGWKKVAGFYVNSDGQRMDGVLSRGIDVSRYQNKIDWNAVAQDDVSFAIIRVGSLKYGVDARFHENMHAANAHGIRTGIYLYSYASTPEEAKAEAEFLLSNIGDYQVTFPIAYDIEDSVQKSLSPQETAALINAFCSTIEAHGYYPIVYSSKSWFLNRIDTSLIEQYDKWVAQYYSVCEYPDPALWQASSSGSINGIEGRVDIDFQYKDYSSAFVQNGWLWRAGNWFYFLDHRKQTGWITDQGNYYYLNAVGAMQNGWHLEGTDWFYLGAGGAMQTGWSNINDAFYFFNSSGVMQTGWTEINDEQYYFDGSGAMLTGWYLDGTDYYYLDETDGSMATGWNFVDNNWYYMNHNGVMQTGFLNIDGASYLLAASGAMQTGWQLFNDGYHYFHKTGPMATGFSTIENDTYYFDDNGLMATGWTELSDGWYYFGGNGAMKTGFQTLGTGSFYFAENGKMATGWTSIGNDWYYFDENGYKMTGWLELKDESTGESAWYYLDSEGIMQTGWQGDTYLDASGQMQTGWLLLDGKWYYLNEQSGAKTVGWLELKNETDGTSTWYYFDADGVMLSDQTADIDGTAYQFDASGAWITP